MRTHKLTHLPSFSFGTLFSFTHLWVLLFLTACLLLSVVQEAEAATFNVTKTADTDDGMCDGDCSLREAIAAANGNSQADQINLPAGTYTLTTSAQLTVSSDIVISGAGESTTIIEAHVNPNTATWRVFNVTSNGTDVTFEDITIRHGRTSLDGGGGGVYIELGSGSSGTATFTRVTITDNRNIGNSNVNGGGLYINDDITTVTLTECTISNNTSGDNGGGFHQSGAVNFNLTDCVISGNSAIDGGGGRVSESGSTNTFTRCTISGNMAGGGSNDDGAGLRISNGTYIFKNCTITGNTNAARGGGIYDSSDANTVEFYSCTIANNTASNEGGGIYFSSGTNSMTNCIIADNTDGIGANDIHFSSGTLASNVTNLVENCTGTCPTFSLNTDPGLGSPTTCNGGTVLQISAGSSAEDAGTSGGNAPSDDICKEARSNPPDLGSFEIVSPLPIELIYFRGNAIGDNTVRVEWMTASEVNNDYFTIERSCNGAAFDAIGKLKASGESNTPITYSYIDDQIDKGQFRIYYRLRQTDYDGNSTLSEIVTMSLEKENGFDIASLFADPQNLSVTFDAAVDNKITSSIFDLTGRLMSVETYQPRKGIYTISLDIGPFTTGMYILHLSDGQRWVSEKFVKP